MDLLTTQFIVDSTLMTTDEDMKNHGIYIQPLYLSVNGQSLKDGIECTSDELYNLLREGAHAMTSQPSVGDFAKTYELCKRQGKRVLFVFTIDEKLSGTHQSAVAAKELVDNIEVYVINTGLTTALIGEIVKEIQHYAETHTVEEVLTYSEQSFNGIGLYASVATLKYLERGGRLSKANAIIGNFLKIKPVLSFLRNQPIQVIGKERTMNKVYEQLFTKIEAHHPKSLTLLTTDQSNLEQEKILLEKCQAHFPNLPITTYPLCSVLGAHVGPEASVIAFR